MLKARQSNDRERSTPKEALLVPVDSPILSLSVGGQVIVPGTTVIFSTKALPPVVTSIAGAVAGATMPGAGLGGLGVIGTQFFDPKNGNAINLTETFQPIKVERRK
jgi:hypothetical protein